MILALLATLWIVFSVAMMVLLGWKKEFVTRRFMTRVEVMERISDKLVDIVNISLSIVLSIILAIGYCISVKRFIDVFKAIDATMPRDSSAGWSFFFTVILFVIAFGIIVLVIQCHKKAMMLAYEESHRAHEKVMVTEIAQFLAEKS
ncbi:hypothetical protein IKE82_00450 [Candidatus Saccharibacteria bacterium]|nr:hypothetical protein [Candidatus Saccharibacteria bacterium]